MPSGQRSEQTPIRCNDPDLRDGKTTTGWLWALARPGGDAHFEWRQNRRHGELTTLLGDYQGLLQSDGYEAYRAHAATHEGVEWLGCQAHARRKIFEAANENPKPAEKILSLIAQLYAHERDRDEQKVGDQRATLRQQHLEQPLAGLRATVTELQLQVLPKSGLGTASAYLLSHWTPLTAHLKHSQTRLDTNAVENAIRRKQTRAENWLFISDPECGDQAAEIYTLVISCQRRDIDPHAYLRDVLTRLPSMTNKDDLGPLLPSQWKAPAPNAS